MKAKIMAFWQGLYKRFSPKAKAKKIAAEKRKRLIAILTVFFIIIVILLLVTTPILAYELIYKDKIFTGVYVDGINLGGLTRDQAYSKLTQHIDNLRQNGLNFYYKNDKLNIGTTVVSPQDPDLAYEILSFEIETMIGQAFNYGRDKTSDANLLNQVKSILNQQEIDLLYTINEQELINYLKAKYGKYEQPPTDAQIVFKEDKIEISPARQGFIIDYDQAIDNLRNNINLIAINSVELKTKMSLPQVVEIEAQQLIPEIDNFLKNEKIILKYQENTWEIFTEEFKNWLSFIKEDNQVRLNFNQSDLEKKLAEISQQINIAPQNAKFNLIDGKVTEFQPSAPGLEVDILANIAKLNIEIFNNKQLEIDLIVTESPAEITTGEVNGYGIKEIIGVGQSDFAGSSNNRITNIRNAATHLNGWLIKPDEEFSLVEAIGEVNAATGYVPEYVIKGDRTIPEYGGGLCQIGTTMFRVALYSGVPITERKPHSYIVSYYYPLGMDATIYGPHPDLRFKNDTGHYILLQTEIEGTFITFTFWGTSDGRKIEITDPENYNWRSPGPAKLIENPNLAPGEKKLIERARKGADTHFYRYITKANGEKIEEIWRSHYAAWPAIYEIGVEPTIESEESNENGTETNTENITNPEGNSANTSQ